MLTCKVDKVWTLEQGKILKYYNYMNIKYWNIRKFTYEIKFVENTEILYRLTQPMTNIA